MTTVAVAACRNHVDREAIGICISCRDRICTECVTKVDGINYCVGCYARLADRGAARERAGHRPTPRGLARAAAVGLLGLATVLTWLMLEVALPGAGG